MTKPDKPEARRERAMWNERYANKEFVWTAKANQFLVAETAGLTPGRALDLAAGEARNAVFLAEQGWQVLAVDFSEIGLDKGHKLAEARNVADKIDFKPADLREYAPEPGQFDLVAIFYLHMGWDELEPIIQRAAEAVAPGGTLLLVAHDSTNLTDGHGGPQNPDVLYSAQQVVAAIGDRLTIEKAGPVTRQVETDDGIKTAIDCLVRAKRS